MMHGSGGMGVKCRVCAKSGETNKGSMFYWICVSVHKQCGTMNWDKIECKQNEMQHATDIQMEGN